MQTIAFKMPRRGQPIQVVHKDDRTGSYPKVSSIFKLQGVLSFMKATAAQLEADIAVLADPYSGFVKVIHGVKLTIRSCNAASTQAERIVKAEAGSPRSRRCRDIRN
ncbi:hypothetical protein RY831_26250 [Noviherbaspirillum sp. CPCC 100848]|uniref:Transposase n=1 Tax=Noviherbaspirillum album TaxID=3080276 RepID=A0ABU6JG81_9BURK|nr:hypothetical protein [Noviherbaspirillum sp. CPCC 100848]MEC4722674.1 hypothetical protein [Noviherbaspirillum sp. CPCC 100848]